MTPNEIIFTSLAVVFLSFVAWVECSWIINGYREYIKEFDKLLTADSIFRNPSPESPSYTKKKP